jgi:hypothetical protein
MDSARRWFAAASPLALGLLLVVPAANCSKAEGVAESTFPPPADAGTGGKDSGPILDTNLGDTALPPACTDPTDTDGDGIADVLEGGAGKDTDGDGTPDYQDLDSDSDTVPDKDEAANPLLPAGAPGKVRDNPCSPLADSDGDGTPDVRDVDSDEDGVPDGDEKAYDPDGSKGCRVSPDCDGDGVVDVVEVAAGSNPVDKASLPPDSTLYFVVPYQKPEQTREFDFQTGVKSADVYLLVDTTNSMQPAIDNVSASLDTKILPALLNGDPAATPPIPAIPDAWVGVGEFRDVPWAPWGEPGDKPYASRFVVGGQTVLGNLAAPEQGPNGLVAPASVRSILGAMKAGGGGDAPESLTQALWIAATGQPYAAQLGGYWVADPPMCSPPGALGTPCFRADALPVFVLVTDAPLHNGPVAAYDYDPNTTAGTRTYPEAAGAMNAMGAKMVGVSVNTGTPGASRSDMIDLAKKTDSLWHDDAFGGADYPLVTDQDTATGDVSNEVVRLIGLMAGQGLHNVTTAKRNYDCAGGVDCTGDGKPDPEYHNPVVPGDSAPFDASKLVTKVETVPSQAVPLPYAGLDESTFYGVRGDASVRFRVHAQNSVLNPSHLMVLRALVRVQTPKGQLLGGAKGVKVVYLVVPKWIPPLR